MAGGLKQTWNHAECRGFPASVWLGPDEHKQKGIKVSNTNSVIL